MTHFAVKSEDVDGETKFECIVVSPEFDGMEHEDRQTKLKELLSTETEKVEHFDLQTWTPDQWEVKKPSNQLDFDSQPELME